MTESRRISITHKREGNYNMNFQTNQILDDQLDNICAGGQLSNGERTFWAFFNLNPIVGLAMLVSAEISRPGGAKEYAEAIYLGKESNIFG
jgi:hypothetical protein